MIWFSGSKYCFLYFRREVYCINFETMERNCCKSNTKYATITWIANEEKRGWNDGEFNWGWKLYDYRPLFFMHLSGWNFRKDIYFSYRSPSFLPLFLSLGLGYRQVVTVKRVRALVACFWVSIALLATVVFHSVRIALGIAFAVLLSCIIISTFCYIKIYHALRLRLSPAQRQGHQGQPNGEGIQQSKARYKETASTIVWVQMTLLVIFFKFRKQ